MAAGPADWRADGAAAAFVLPEVENRAEYVELVGGGGVALGGHAAIVMQQGDNAVGGAEIDADGLDHAGAPPKGAGSSANVDGTQE